MGYTKARIRDGLTFLSTLSVKRAVNILLTTASYYFSRLTKNAVHWGYPISISIEPTTSCNLRCPECPSGLRAFSRPTGMLEMDTFRHTIDSVSDYTPYLILYFQGEPYLNRHFFDFVKYAGSKNMYTATSTNGHYLTDENARRTIESGISRLIISIDGTSQETYSNYRIGGNLEKVIEGTRRVVEWKRKLKSGTPHIIFQFLVVRQNEHQINDVIALAEQLGVDEVKFKTAQVYDYENGNDLIPLNGKYSRYIKTKEGYRIKNKLLNHCWKLWQSTVVTWDGALVPCCFDKDATHQLGRISDHRFKDIWNGDAYSRFRNSVLRSRKEIDICKNCTEGTKVWA